MDENRKNTAYYGTELYNYSLKHADKNYKYIKKEMVNGRMRYYYDENTPKGTLKTAARDPEKKQTAWDKFKDWAGVDEMERYYKNDKKLKSQENLTEKLRTGESVKKSNVSDEEYEKTKTAREKTREQYKNTLLGKVDTTLGLVQDFLKGDIGDNEDFQEFADDLDKLYEKIKNKVQAKKKSGNTKTTSIASITSDGGVNIKDSRGGKVETYKDRMARLEAKEKKKRN